MQLDRRYLLNFDWGTLVLALAITALGVVLLYSATHDRTDHLSGIYLKQLLWLGISLGLMCIVLWVDYQLLCRYAYLLYALLNVSLVALLFLGPVINGAQRWLVLGSWRLQPSEIAKLVLILVLARYFTSGSHQNAAPLTLRDLPVPLLLVGLPFSFIVQQPDLSTALVLLVILGLMVGVIGMQRKALLTVAAFGLSVLPLSWYVLKDYQRHRLLSILRPQADLLGTGYHGWQSKIAIGSGGFWGKGLFAGTQSHLNFLPEKHTDFIFAVLGEEMGFVGVLLLVGLFGLLLGHGLSTAMRTRDRLGTLLAVGVVTVMSVQVLLNIGMTIGLLPIIGLPLPLMSYGGSSLVTTFISLGLLMNVRMRRVKF